MNKRFRERLLSTRLYLALVGGGTVVAVVLGALRVLPHSVEHELFGWIVALDSARSIATFVLGLLILFAAALHSDVARRRSVGVVLAFLVLEMLPDLPDLFRGGDLHLPHLAAHLVLIWWGALLVRGRMRTSENLNEDLDTRRI